MTRVGFIINSRVPGLRAMGRGMLPHHLVGGWDDQTSPMSFMRFHWVADRLRRNRLADYRLYRPGHHYDVVIFLKSMGQTCLGLAKDLRTKGTPFLFEANVDYYTLPPERVAAISAMAPTEEQRSDAIAITAYADGVIASSRRLGEVCAKYQERVVFVPDNVNFDFRPRLVQRNPFQDGKLRIWWSGMADKAFELLMAEQALLDLRRHIHLHLVTGSLKAAEAWPADVRARFDALLATVPHTIHQFRDIPDLMERYAYGGVIISPRSLDTPYNHSHTEWKITLGMACDLPAVASPVPAYVDVAEAADPGAATICQTQDDWLEAIAQFVGQPESVAKIGMQAGQIVRDRYSTERVALRHLDAVEKLALAKRK